MTGRLDMVSLGAALLILLALFLPATATEEATFGWLSQSAAFGVVLLALAVALAQSWLRLNGLSAGLGLAVAVAIGAAGPVLLLAGMPGAGAGAGVWIFVIGLALLAWRTLEVLSASGGDKTVNRLLMLLVPALFGIWLLYLWQVVVVGLQVPSVLLPAPSLIGGVLAGAQSTLAADFHQTFIKSVLPGFAMGCGAGFAVAILVDRVPFLQRGLLPLGNLVSALPIVGIAPIMVMWFGFDWQSKAAVIVVMTFFPMLVNTIAGLNATGAIEHDLMRSYGASYPQTLIRVRLPNALPFIFNALKINSTLALIGAIVAEFFGTPIVGMGFRISTEVGRMNVEMVWATIAVAALSGSLFYGLLALLERITTFWHPSYRG